MKILRGSTLSPIRSVKIRSARAASSTLTRSTSGSPGPSSFPQLVGVHLAEALEALRFEAAAGELEHLWRALALPRTTAVPM